MKTKFDIGEKVYFKATIKNIEVFPNDKIAYRVKEWPDILFTENDLSENNEPLQHIVNTLERIEKKLPEKNNVRIPVLIGGDEVDNIALNMLATADLVEELEMREGVSSIFVGPSNKTDIKVDGPAVVLLVVD